MSKVLSMKALYDEKFSPESLIKKMQLLSSKVKVEKDINLEFTRICDEMKMAYENYRSHFERFDLVTDEEFIDYYAYLIKAEEARIKGLYKRACMLTEKT